MKKSIVIFLANFLFILSLSCDKNKLTPEDIVQTNLQGDIVSEGSSNDWSLMDIKDKDIFLPLSTRNYGTNGEPIIQDGINFNCTKDSVEVIVYPNPVVPGHNPHLWIKSEKVIIDFSMAYGEYGKSSAGTVGGVNSNILSQNGYEVFLELGEELNWPEDKVQLYIFILTEDSCAYYTAGKILYD